MRSTCRWAMLRAKSESTSPVSWSNYFAICKYAVAPTRFSICLICGTKESIAAAWTGIRSATDSSQRIRAAEMHPNSAVRMVWIKSAKLEVARIFCVRWKSAQTFRQLGEFVGGSDRFRYDQRKAIQATEQELQYILVQPNDLDSVFHMSFRTRISYRTFGQRSRLRVLLTPFFPSLFSIQEVLIRDSF